MLEFTYDFFIGGKVLLGEVELLTDDILTLFCFTELLPKALVGGQFFLLDLQVSFVLLSLDELLKPLEYFISSEESTERIDFTDCLLIIIVALFPIIFIIRCHH
jgi:hypothetical protein